jgi:hypothetical protein
MSHQPLINRIKAGLSHSELRHVGCFAFNSALEGLDPRDSDFQAAVEAAINEHAREPSRRNLVGAVEVFKLYVRAVDYRPNRLCEVGEFLGQLSNEVFLDCARAFWNLKRVCNDEIHIPSVFRDELAVRVTSANPELARLSKELLDFLTQTV